MPLKARGASIRRSSWASMIVPMEKFSLNLLCSGDISPLGLFMATTPQPANTKEVITKTNVRAILFIWVHFKWVESQESLW